MDPSLLGVVSSDKLIQVAEIHRNPAPVRSNFLVLLAMGTPLARYCLVLTVISHFAARQDIGLPQPAGIRDPHTTAAHSA